MTIWHGVITGTVDGLATPGGTGYSRTSVTFSGDKALVLVPDQVVRGASVGVMLFAHGYTETETRINDPGPNGLRDGFLEAGWIVISGNNGGFQWGSPAAMKHLRSQHAWALTRWAVDRVVLVGGSMGGLTVLNALGRDELPDVVGAVAIVAVVDTQAMGSGYHSSILQSYGAASMAELTAKQAGYDPARDDPAKWAGKKLWLGQGSSDTLVPPDLHGDVFMARHPSPGDVRYEVRAHPHGGGWYTSEIMDWLALAPYDSAQTAPEPPPPISGGDGRLRSVAGDAVTLRDAAGAVVALA